MISDDDRSRCASSRSHTSLNLFCFFLKWFQIETFRSIGVIGQIFGFKVWFESVETWPGKYISFDWFNFSSFNANIWPDFWWLWFNVIYTSLRIKIKGSNLTNCTLLLTWISLFSSCSFSKFVSIFICSKISLTSGLPFCSASTSGSFWSWWFGTSGSTLSTSGFTARWNWIEENESLKINWAHWYPI